MIKELNEVLSRSFLRFEFDFYEDFEDFDYSEMSISESPLSIINCLICKEPLFLTLPKNDTNREILDRIIDILKSRKVDEHVIKNIEKLKLLPICRFDLFELLSIIIKEKELKGLFRKLTSFYDFDNIKK